MNYSKGGDKMKQKTIFMAIFVASSLAFAQNPKFCTNGFSINRSIVHNAKFNKSLLPQNVRIFRNYEYLLVEINPSYSSTKIKFNTITTEQISQQINTIRLAGEFFAGATGSFIGGIASYSVFRKITPDELGRLYIIGIPFGYALGSAIGVFLIGNIGNETGSFGTSLLGGLLGGTAAAYFLLVSSDVGRFEDDFWGDILDSNSLLWIVPPVLFSMIGFNITRGYDALPVSDNAVINIKNNQVSFAFPGIYFKPNPFIHGDHYKMVDLIQLNLSNYPF